MTILTAVACIISVLLPLYVLWGHLFHWTKPKEQKQIVRIIVFVPFVSVCQLFSVWFYNAAGYITPVGEYYEGFAITSLFLLYLALVSPDESRREQFFDSLERRWLSGKKKGSHGSLRWFRILCIMAFQITIFRIGTCIATEVLWAYTCPLNPARKYGLIAISTIQGTSTGFAVWACIILERRLKAELEPHQGTMKLYSFKAVVFLQAIQQILFAVLANHGGFKPSVPFRISYMDFATGLPNLIFAWELVLVAVFFLKTFTFKPYMDEVREGAVVHASAGAALLHSFNTADVFQGLAYAFAPWATKKGHSLDYSDAVDKDEPTSYQGSSFLRDAGAEAQDNKD